MNKTELIAKVVEETQLSKKDAAAAVNATFAAITGELVKDPNSKIQFKEVLSVGVLFNL